MAVTWYERMFNVHSGDLTTDVHKKMLRVVAVVTLVCVAAVVIAFLALVVAWN